LASLKFPAFSMGMNKMIKTAVVGASGYTGMELLRLLLMHPNADLCCVTSRQYAGQALSEVFPRYKAAKGSELAFSEPDAKSIAATGAEVAFLALPHGVAAEYATALLELGIKVIDLSADFRLNDAVASPGCYPTSVSLPLLPMLEAKLIDPQSIVTCSMSGVSGAGKTGNVMFSYCEANESARAYSVPKHRHLSEIEQELSIAAGEKVTMSFTPHLIPTHNGICSTTSAKFIGTEADLSKVDAIFEEAYGESYFVRLLGKGNP